MKDYTNALREHNLKVTPQRLAISQTLDTFGHISIDELYDVMIEKFNSISLATIYKNMNLMISNSFVEEVKLPNNKSVYELAKTSHAHLLCDKCKKVEDLHINLEQIAKESLQKTSFKVLDTSLVFRGVCENCL